MSRVTRILSGLAADPGSLEPNASPGNRLYGGMHVEMSGELSMSVPYEVR